MVDRSTHGSLRRVGDSHSTSSGNLGLGLIVSIVLPSSDHGRILRERNGSKRSERTEPAMSAADRMMFNIVYELRVMCDRG